MRSVDSKNHKLHYALWGLLRVKNQSSLCTMCSVDSQGLEFAALCEARLLCPMCSVDSL